MNYDFLIILQTSADTVGEANNWSTFSTVAQLFYYLIVFALVIGGAYYTTKLLGRSRMGKRTSNISIIESVSVGNQGSVQLCRVGEKYLLIGVSKDGIRALTEVDADQINLPDTSVGHPAPFEKYLRQFMSSRQKSKTDWMPGEETGTPEKKGENADDDSASDS